MIVFHGSYKKFTSFDLSKCKAGSDFGQGLYFTTDKTTAINWATQLYNKYSSVPHAGKYLYSCTIDLAEIKTMYNYKHFNLSVEWFDYIISNRNNLHCLQYDIIEGPIADNKLHIWMDKYQSLRNSNTVTEHELFRIAQQSVKLTPTNQICIKNESIVNILNSNLRRTTL